MACNVTGALLLIDIKRCKEGKNNIKFHIKIGMKEACTKIMTEAKKGIGQRDIKGDTKD